MASVARLALPDGVQRLGGYAGSGGFRDRTVKSATGTGMVGGGLLDSPQ